jgi:hypothetical protein
MTTPRQELNGSKPIDLVRSGKGMAVLELQYAEWPGTAKIDAASRLRVVA